MELTENSILDPRTRRYVTPCRVVWQSGGPNAPKNAEALLDKDDQTICEMSFKDKKADAPAVILDFGRELHGGLQIENGMTKSHDPVRVHLTFGESVSEAMGHPNQDHTIHEETISIPWYGHQEYGNTGFRFVRIEMLDPGAELKLKWVCAVFLYRDIPYKGEFRCNDDRLNQVWKTGAYTVHLCMQDMLWDGIKRDRLVWIGDMHPETMTINSVFGEVDVVPKSLNYVRDRTPLENGPNWMNGISSYSLWWLLIQRCWYQYHANRDYLEEQRKYLKALLNVLHTQVEPNGSEKLGGGRFLDWPSSEDPTAIHAGLHALLLMAFNGGAELMDILGEPAEKDACLASAAKMKQYKPGPTKRKQANALLALAGIEDPARINAEALANEPLRDISTFYGYYVLQARALAGDFAGPLDVIRNYWGAMLDYGATTFWEDFDLAWTKNAARIDQPVPDGKIDIHGDYGKYCYVGLRHSLCHGWASGPTSWMIEHVLGFRPLEPGSAQLRVKPALAGLEWAEGAFPTPRGVVRVRHEATAGGEVKTTIVEKPEGINIVQS